MNFPISEILDEAWTLSKKHGITLAVFFLLLAFLSNGLSFAFMPAGYWDAIVSGNSDLIHSYSRWNLGSILEILISCVGGVGVAVTTLRLARGSQENINLSSFKLPLETYLKYIGWSLLYGFIVAVGLILLIVPGIYLATRLGFAGIYLVDHPTASIEEAVKFSWNKTDGHVLNLIGLGILSLIIVLLGLLACCVGIFFTMVISNFAFVLAYLFIADPTRMATHAQNAQSNSGYDKTAY